MRFDDTINADSTVALFKQLDEIRLAAAWTDASCDNSRCHRAKGDEEYLKTSRVNRARLPLYAPNLAVIERTWKFFKTKPFYNRYFAAFAEFKAACDEIGANPARHHEDLRALLSESFPLGG